jgi:hypothetical protein
MAPRITWHAANLLQVRAVSSLYSSTLTNGTSRVVFTAELRSGHRFSAGIDPNLNPILGQRVQQLVELDNSGLFENTVLYLKGEAIVLRVTNADGETMETYMQMAVWEVFFDHPLVEAALSVPLVL